MDRMEKLRTSLQHTLHEAQRVAEEGIKHRMTDLGAELVKLGNEVKKAAGGKRRKISPPVRRPRIAVEKKELHN